MDSGTICFTLCDSVFELLGARVRVEVFFLYKRQGRNHLPAPQPFATILFIYVKKGKIRYLETVC